MRRERQAPRRDGWQWTGQSRGKTARSQPGADPNPSSGRSRRLTTVPATSWTPVRSMPAWACRGFSRFAASAVASWRRIYIDYVEPPARLTISTCAGCGAMREFESCVSGCSERKLELVGGGEYDELTMAAAARRGRIQAFRTVVEELVAMELGRDEWRIACEALRQSARSVLRRFGAASQSGADDSLSPLETVIVWRCPECGGVDAPEPCIGVCIWRPADWVDANVYESERSQAVLDLAVEHALAGLLRRAAFVTPHHGQWERNWLALQSQARLLSQSRRSRRDRSDASIGPAPADE